MKRCEINSHESKITIRPSEGSELFELTVQDRNTGEYLTVFLTKEALARLVGQIEVVVDLL